MQEVLTAVVMKSSIFWDITLCSPLKVNQRLGGTCHLHVQDRRISQERNQHEAELCYLLVSCFTYSSILKTELTRFSEMLVDFQQTTQRYNPEDKP
jgi:hypothetical protein